MATTRGHQFVTGRHRRDHEAGRVDRGRNEVAEEVEAELKQKMDLWQKRALRTLRGSQLGYESEEGQRDDRPAPQAEHRDRGTSSPASTRSGMSSRPSLLILDDYNLDDEADSTNAAGRGGGDP